MGYLAPCYLFTSQVTFSYTDVQPFLSSAAVCDAFILEAEATDLWTEFFFWNPIYYFNIPVCCVFQCWGGDEPDDRGVQTTHNDSHLPDSSFGSRFSQNTFDSRFPESGFDSRFSDRGFDDFPSGRMGFGHSDGLQRDISGYDWRQRWVTIFMCVYSCVICLVHCAVVDGFPNTVWTSLSTLQ